MTHKKEVGILLTAIALVGVVATTVTVACSSNETAKTPTDPTDLPDSAAVSDAGQIYRATANIGATTEAGTLQGTATFVEQNGAVTAQVAVTGASPAGLHGLHIHQGNNCNAVTSDAGVVTPGGGAGGHWNPTDAGHGDPASSSHHFGDMGNITIGADGKGSLTLTSTQWRVAGDGPDSVVGHAVVFHAGTDDLMTQPTGDAGARPGCGVIARVP
jgi:superoxide dismutase, Cu-Zn family